MQVLRSRKLRRNFRLLSVKSRDQTLILRKWKDPKKRLEREVDLPRASLVVRLSQPAPSPVRSATTVLSTDDPVRVDRLRPPAFGV
jgi:hypothetical protein